jgi:hypothetical protein
MDEEKFRYAPLFLGIPAAALVAPLFLIFIERILPYPYVIEELVKFSLVILIIRLPNLNSQLKLTFLAGILFSLSESLFYLGMAFSGGFAFLFLKKLFLITPLHLLTLFLFLFCLKKFKKIAIFSLPIAFGIHFFFNQLF